MKKNILFKTSTVRRSIKRQAWSIAKKSFNWILVPHNRFHNSWKEKFVHRTDRSSYAARQPERYSFWPCGAYYCLAKTRSTGMMFTRRNILCLRYLLPYSISGAFTCPVPIYLTSIRFSLTCLHYMAVIPFGTITKFIHCRTYTLFHANENSVFFSYIMCFIAPIYNASC